MKMFATSLVLLSIASQAHALALHGIGCAPTAEAAVEHLLSNTDAGGKKTGFRVQDVHIDRVHGQAWAMIAACDAPSRPLTALALPRSVMDGSKSTLQASMHAGDPVVVLSGGAESRIQLNGWLEDAASLGSVVHVRLQPSLFEDAGHVAETRGTLIRRGVVEVER